MAVGSIKEGAAKLIRLVLTPLPSKIRLSLTIAETASIAQPTFSLAEKRRVHQVEMIGGANAISYSWVLLMGFTAFHPPTDVP